MLVSSIGVYDEVLRDAGGLSDVTITDEVEEPEEEEIVFEWEKNKEETPEGSGEEAAEPQEEPAEETPQD